MGKRGSPWTDIYLYKRATTTKSVGEGVKRDSIKTDGYEPTA